MPKATIEERLRTLIAELANVSNNVYLLMEEIHKENASLYCIHKRPSTKLEIWDIVRKYDNYVVASFTQHTNAEAYLNGMNQTVSKDTAETTRISVTRPWISVSNT